MKADCISLAVKSLLCLCSHPGPRLETRVRDDDIMTHRTFISWMSGHTHPSQWAPGSGCSVCFRTCAHCTLGSRVLPGEHAIPLMNGVHVAFTWCGGFPKRDKGLGDASTHCASVHESEVMNGAHGQAGLSFSTPGSADVVPV